MITEPITRTLSRRPCMAMEQEEQEIDLNEIQEEYLSIKKRNQINQNNKLILKSLTAHGRKRFILKRKFLQEMFFWATMLTNGKVYKIIAKKLSVKEY